MKISIDKENKTLTIPNGTSCHELEAQLVELERAYSDIRTYTIEVESVNSPFIPTWPPFTPSPEVDPHCPPYYVTCVCSNNNDISK